MNFKGVGSIFCLIAALLYGARYIAAGLYVSGSPTISADVFGAGLASVGSTLLIVAIVALVIGLCFLAMGFAKDGKD